MHFSSAYIVILCAFFIGKCICYTPKANQTIDEFCKEDTGVTQEIVDKIFENPDKEFTLDENCYIHCVFTELGYLDDEGNVVMEKFKELKEEITEIDIQCLEETPQILDCSDVKFLKNCNV